MCSVITTVMEMPVHCSDWCRETQHALYIYTNVAVYSHKYQEHMFCKNHMVVTSLRVWNGTFNFKLMLNVISWGLQNFESASILMNCSYTIRKILSKRMRYYILPLHILMGGVKVSLGSFLGKNPELESDWCK